MKLPPALKYIFFVILCAAISIKGFSQTAVPYNILKSTTWTKSGSPYQIKNAVNIAPNVELTIEKGTVVEFYDNGEIQLSGILNANGTAADSIWFISKVTDNPIEFKSLTLNKGCVFVLGYCSVQNHSNFVDNNEAQSLKVSNSYFFNNIYVFSGTTRNLIILKNSKFISNKTCISKMFVSVDSSSFISNTTGMDGVIGYISHSDFILNNRAAIKETSLIHLDSNTFSFNGIGLQYKSESQELYLKDNIFTSNRTGIQISGNSLPSPYTVVNNKLCNDLYNIENQSTLRFNFSNNCWCNADTINIESTILDTAGGHVFFQPLHPSCRGCKPLPYADNNTACTNTQVNLKAHNLYNPVYEKYSWTRAGFGRSDSLSYVALLQNDSNETIFAQFQLTITTNYCKDSATVTVAVYPKNDRHCRNCNLINAGPDTTICSGNEIVLGASLGNSFYQFSWTPAEGIENIFSERPVFLFENKSSETIVKRYALTVIDSAAGCYNTDSVFITVLSEYNMRCKGFPPLHIYNVITPNGDAENQHFTIDNIEFYPQNEVSVYNRWGNRIMHRKSYANDWDGNNLPDGVYYYVVSIPEISQEFKGDLTIKK